MAFMVIIVHHHGTEWQSVACKSPSFLWGIAHFIYVRTYGQRGQSPMVSLSALLHSPALLSMPCMYRAKTKKQKKLHHAA